MITLKEKLGELFKSVCYGSEKKLSDAEMERDRMTWDKRNCVWAAMYETNSQHESQKTELHHANQWACQAQMQSRSMFEELTTKK